MRAKKKVNRLSIRKCVHNYLQAEKKVFPVRDYDEGGFQEDGHFAFKLLLYCTNCADVVVKRGRF